MEPRYIDIYKYRTSYSDKIRVGLYLPENCLGKVRLYNLPSEYHTEFTEDYKLLVRNSQGDECTISLSGASVMLYDPSKGTNVRLYAKGKK